VQGVSRVLFVGHGRPEQGHEAIVGELGDSTSIPVDLLREEGKAPADERQQLFGGKALCQHTASHNRRTQHGNLFALACQDAAHRWNLVSKAARGSDLRGGRTQVGGVNGRRSVAGALYLGQRAVRRSGGAFLYGCHEAISVAAERLDTALLHPVIGHGLANHAQAMCQRRFGNKLVGPAGRQGFVFRDGTMALRQEMYEDQKRLGFEGVYDARSAQFPAVDVEGARAKHKDHGTAPPE
jgi:hypothetical protein